MRRVLAKDVYDTIELSAEAYGGIGAGGYFDYDEDGDSAVAPRCYMGHLYWTGVLRTEDLPFAHLGISTRDNDDAVRDVGKGASRIPFSDWCKELGVIRGEE